MIIRNPSGSTRVPSMTSRLFHNIAWWERHCLPFVSIALSQKRGSWYCIFSCRRWFPIITLGQYMPLLVQHKLPFHLNRLSQWQRTVRSAHDWLQSERLYFDVEPEASSKKVETFALLLVDYDSFCFVSFRLPVCYTSNYHRVTQLSELQICTQLLYFWLGRLGAIVNSGPYKLNQKTRPSMFILCLLCRCSTNSCPSKRRLETH